MRKRSRKGGPARSILTERGGVSIPLALLLCAVLFASLGLWRVLHDWRMIRDRQLRLSYCIAEHTQKVAARLNRVRNLDRGIRATRAALAVAVVPQVRASLMATLQALNIWVQAETTGWSVTAASWRIRRGCGDVPSALPLMYPPRPWTIEPPDSLGPRPLRWSEAHALEIQLAAWPRFSRAWVLKKEGGWRAQWRGPDSP